MKNTTKSLLSLFVLLASILSNAQASNETSEVSKIDHVLHISVDGLRPDVLTSLGAQNVPNFFRFRTEGAWTDNARTDVLNTSTIPGHTSHITGRPVFGDQGHGFWWNSDPGPFTLHSQTYIASVFDVVHDHGFSTALYAGKSKFILYENSYDADSGAADGIGVDNGRDKIDTYVNTSDMQALASTFIEDYKTQQYTYAFFHFRNPDGQGHSTGWELNTISAYAQKVAEIDALLGRFFQVIETTPGLAGRTAIILTADHGGEEGKKNHGNLFDPDNYTIPFYVWGPGITPGADLYALNTDIRKDPGTRQPTDDGSLLPIRYGEVANLALNLLALPSVPGSVYNADQSLKVTSSQNNTILVFQQGLNQYRGTVDTYVRRHERNSSYGSRGTLLVDDADPWWSGRDNQSLLRFQNIIGSAQGQIPNDASIQKATLQVRVVNEGKGGRFHRMLTSWDENETWNTLNNGISANDQEAISQPDSEVSTVKKGMLSIDVTTSLQAWAKGQTNYGWAILPTRGNGWDFYSSEGFMAPRLIVSYADQAPESKTNTSIVDLQNTKISTLEDSKTKNEDPITSSNDIKPLLWGNFPNPFTDTTTIGFSIPEKQQVTVSIYTTQGQFVATLANKTFEAGRHLIRYTPKNIRQGMYIVKFVAKGTKGTTEQTKKMIFK
ncbi:alkaline phosphatase family protein [Aquimarina sp. U1-2]|uniref:alkaline phosphatase family protein n=1 Tax=Aquimarina sp. U1-2 TaxID=2823141 RepID=UPI001AED0D63|nr:alkaline phosphatase family protein [Aquimarina sp. U1-2]MBP2833128.1 alkaline phosphatase family protein [Aquimarina sp. U1-2]